MMKKKTSLLLVLLLPLLLLNACGKGKSRQEAREAAAPVQDQPIVVETAGEDDPIANPAAVRGGSFTSWAGPYPKSLNMWLDYNAFSKQVTELMFESLVAMHSTQDEPVGLLAESWEISDDKKSYTFRLHPQAKWSDGKPITAEDVQFYYDVIMNPKNLTSLFRVALSRFARPEVLDERTIRFTATEAHWKNFWDVASSAAFPRHVWGNVDFNAQNFEFPVVSGPYTLAEVKTDRSIKLKRRGDWWARVKKFNNHKYNFDFVVFKAMEDRNKALELLKRGEFDAYPVYTSQIWAEKTHFPQVEKNWVVRQKIFNKEPMAFQGFAMNMRRPLFQDVRVRKAMSHLLNRELMNEKLMFREYFLLNSYYPDLYPGNLNPAAPTLAYDPVQARTLFKEAGWEVGSDGVLAKEGNLFDLVFLHHEGSDLRHLNIYLEDMKAVGIRAKIDLVSRATFTKRTDNHDFDMIWTNWSASRLRDPEEMWHSKTADEVAGQNHAAVKDEVIDRLIEEQRLEMDLGKRNEIMRRIDQRLTTIIPYVLMWLPDHHNLLYWNRFGFPKSVYNKFDREDAIVPYWFLHPEKARQLDEAMSKDAALPAAEPAEVHYTE